VDALYEQIIFYLAGVGAIILGILATAGTGGLALASGVPESLILLGFGSILTGSVIK
jgi:hypothetical protein